jgi:putative solute:sodium symporter small subunit
MAQSVENQQWGGDRSDQYWKKSLRLQIGLLVIWFVVPYVFGILLAEPLHDVNFFGFPLSFWIAQNGAIFLFVALIFIFANRMDHLDHEYDVHEEDLSAAVRDRLTKKAAKRTGGAQ